MSQKTQTNSNNTNDSVELTGLVEVFAQTQSTIQTQTVKAVDIGLVVRNWLFGWYIVEFEEGSAKRSELYGKRLLTQLSKQLKNKGVPGVSVTNLKQCRLFYESYKKIGQALPDQSLEDGLFEESPSKTDIDLIKNMHHFLVVAHKKLSSSFSLGWTHYVSLLTIKDQAERSFYEIESAQNGWGYRELERQINSGLYQRLSLSRDKDAVKKLAEQGQIVEKPSDIIKNPYILEFTGLESKSSYSEHNLESAIIDKIEHFLLELGKGFLFEARQKKFTFDNRHFFVDLVFYNRLLRSYVLIDLKVGDLKHQDLGQMQMYVNYFNRHVKTTDENPTVGILLCLSKSDELVELTLPEDSNIFASQYQLYMPSKEDLKKQLEEAHREWENKQHSLHLDNDNN